MSESYVQIHSDSYSWFTPIIYDRHLDMLAEGVDSYVAWGRGREPVPELGKSGQRRELRIQSKAGLHRDALLTRLDDRDGFHSRNATGKLLRWLSEINPATVHLHQLHGYYINVDMLFNWLAERECTVIWTLHDCWAFTGHCSYFTYAECEQWKYGCAASEKCPQLNEYPKTIGFGACNRNFKDKERLFTLLPPDRMILYTPSKWLADLVEESFLAKYSVEIHPNPIDSSVFKPTPSDFRLKYCIGNRFMILGVANPWTERKGLSSFIRLAQVLDDSFAIVLIGLSDKQIKYMPKEIIALPSTNSMLDLAKAYSAADVYVQPSDEETYGMTVAEAVACGTPVAVRSGSACVEAAQGGIYRTISNDLSNLKEVVVELANLGVDD